MGGRNFPRHERKKPKKEAQKASWPALPSAADQVEVIHPKGKKGEGEA